jgi:hypothetical protein
MSHSPYTTSVLREAVQGAVGGSITWVLTCTVAGVIATAAGADSIDDVGWVWGLAWLGHLFIAGMGAWGLPVVFIHAMCLGVLLQRTERTMRVLMVAFISQLTTSAIVVAGFEQAHSRRVMIVLVAFTMPAIVYLIRGFLKQAHEY